MARKSPWPPGRASSAVGRADAGRFPAARSSGNTGWLWLICLLSLSGATSAQPPGDDALRRYQEQIRSSAYYGPSDQVPKLRYGPTREARPGLQPKKDAHVGVKGYARRSCESCHEEQTNKLHTLRANNTCRQCHGAGPIAASAHYFSLMNPLRRHAYVCAKCHEGAGASFATYVVHAPVPSEHRHSVPALYWANVLMYALIVGVMAVFLVHGVGWWIREWFVKRKTET